MSEKPESARARASRANARKSTGPRSRAGKARASRNARRHGLNLPVLACQLAPEVDAIARAIEVSVAGRALDAGPHALACRIAEAQIDLRRVRLVKLPLVAEVAADLKASARPLAALARLERYERRAFARRKAAVREFSAAATGELAKRS